MQSNYDRTFISGSRRVVLKIGSNLLSTNGLADDAKIRNVAEKIHKLKQKVRDVVVVSSGAVSAGSGILGHNIKPTTIQSKQAAASIGQPVIMSKYRKLLSKYGYITGQILLTNLILNNRVSFLNAKNTLEELLKYNVIPIVNENDSVATNEIMFGDNDSLAAMVADIVEADLLILLTDIDGLFDCFGTDNQCLIHLVREIDEKIIECADVTARGSNFSTGGMITKINAAKNAAECSIPTVIANGMQKNIIDKIFSGQEIGTLVLPRSKKYSGRKRWIYMHTKTKGTIFVDAGAKNAIINKGTSLLPSGITNVKGEFSIFDTVNISDNKSNSFAKGIVNYSSDQINVIKGKKSNMIASLLRVNNGEEVIHRDNLVKI